MNDLLFDVPDDRDALIDRHRALFPHSGPIVRQMMVVEVPMHGYPPERCLTGCEWDEGIDVYDWDPSDPVVRL